MTSRVSGGTLAPSSFCWPNLGCGSPLAETPKGSLCWENPGGGAFGCVCVGTDCGDCGDCGRKMCGESAEGLHLHSVAH